MTNGINGTRYSKYAENGNGSSVMTEEGATAHIKLVVSCGKMDFYVNDELSYTYLSPDDHRMSDSVPNNQKANNFTEAGKVGIFSHADRTTISVDNIRVKDIKDGDIPYYANAYTDGTVGIELSNDMSIIDPSFFASHRLNNGAWGKAEYDANSSNVWAHTGNYSNIKLSGNYAIDMNFAMRDPRNDSRWVGIMFGMHINGGTAYYNIAGIRENGEMFIEQKALTASGDETNIKSSNYAKASCASSIPENKKNPDHDGDANMYLLSYMPPNYNSNDPVDVNSRRHSMRLEVSGNVAALTFEGKTISCVIDKNPVDGYFGIRAAGTAVNIYSMTAAKK